MSRTARSTSLLRPASMRAACLAVAIAALATGSAGAAAAADADAAAGTSAIAPGSATVHTRDIQVAQNATGKGAVRCPAGKVAIGGGAVFHHPGAAPTPDIHAKLIASGPTMDGRGWHGAGVAFEASPVDLRITVVCRPAAAVGPYTIRFLDLPVPNGTRTAGSLGCGTGKRFVTGGVLWSPGSGGPDGADNLFVSTPSADGRRWRATGFTYGAGRFLRIVLLCRPASSLGQPTVKHREVTTDASEAGGSVTCGTGRRATAGGVDWYAGGSPSATLGSMTSSGIRLDRKGWYAAASVPSPDVAMRITVLCVPV